jgi:DNA-binding transcriptional LysR family regulator
MQAPPFGHIASHAMDELRALRLFHKVADSGSFRQVAVSEGLTPQAVSKSIGQLEQHLGLRLLSRTTRRSSLTQEGEALRRLTWAPLEDLTQALRRVTASAERIAGVVRVSAAPSARHVLAEPLARFCEAHPEVSIEYLSANRFADIVMEQVDVGFRSGLQPQGELVARRLFTVRQLVCAAPAYLARHGTPASPDELRHHRCTGFRHSESGRLLPWEFEEADGTLRTLEVEPFFRVNDPEVELSLVRAGAAIGQIDTLNAGVDLQEGRLIPLFAERASTRLGFYLYYPSRKRLPRRTRAFIDHMTAALLEVDGAPAARAGRTAQPVQEGRRSGSIP